MNFLILGEGDEELAWAHAVEHQPQHRLVAVYPGFHEFADRTTPRDFDEALALADVEAVVVGGSPEQRIEWLRRAAAAGLATICLHPPGDDSEAYYQVALSRAETGAVLVPDLPARLHPGVERVRQALADETLGPIRTLRHESTAPPDAGDLVRRRFSRVVDLVRSLLSEIEAVTGTGDPAGDRPDQSLVVQLRGSGRRAEVRIATGPAEPDRLVVAGERGSLTLEYPPALIGPARLVHRTAAGDEVVTDFDPWDPHTAILVALEHALAGRDARPNLLDGTRAMELAEATARSLRRGRTVDLNYEEINEANSFKSVMTSTGCVLLLGVMAILPVALAGPALGMDWTLYFAYAVPPVLVLFLVLQTLRFAVREPK